MMIELSPLAYVTLYGLVQDELRTPSDADPLLRRALRELADATSDGLSAAELAEQPGALRALRRSGLLSN